MIQAPARGILRRSRREGAIDLLFILPTLVVLAAFLFYPLAYGVVLSVHETNGFALTTFVGLEHYAHALLGDAVFHRSLLNTFLFTGVAVVLQTGLGLVLAVLDRRREAGADPVHVRVLRALRPCPGGGRCGLEVPVRAVLRDRGHRGLSLGTRHADGRAASEADTALWAIMAAFLWRFAGFSMVVYLAAIQALPREYYEQAALEGAGKVPDSSGGSPGRCSGRRRSCWSCSPPSGPCGSSTWSGS